MSDYSRDLLRNAAKGRMSLSFSLICLSVKFIALLDNIIKTFMRIFRGLSLVMFKISSNSARLFASWGRSSASSAYNFSMCSLKMEAHGFGATDMSTVHSKVGAYNEHEDDGRSQRRMMFWTNRC